MEKLKKDDFNKKYRFRESREEKLVTCATCDNMSGGTNDKEGTAFCNHEERFRKVKIGEYWNLWGGKGENHNISTERVCDAYKSRPLPEGIEKPVLKEGQAILLGSQHDAPYHRDLNCPYVVEELRLLAAEKAQETSWLLKRARIHIADLSDKVPGEVLKDICEMPCCESKLPFQIYYVGYRKKVGIKPDGTEPKVWVRNGIVKHEKNVAMTFEKAEAFFNLKKFDSVEFSKGLGYPHQNICSASEHLRKSSNELGSRPLSEADNPVCFSNHHHHFLKESISGPNSGADFWIYDDRLFDIEKNLEGQIRDLRTIPEGLIPCMDKGGNLRMSISHCGLYLGDHQAYGILRELEDENLLSKGLNHFVEIGAVEYHGNNHRWGVFGRGFDKLAWFDQE